MTSRTRRATTLAALLVVVLTAYGAYAMVGRPSPPAPPSAPCCGGPVDVVAPIESTAPGANPAVRGAGRHQYSRRRHWETSGFGYVVANYRKWPLTASLVEVRDAWVRTPADSFARIDASLARVPAQADATIEGLLEKATLFNYEGDPRRAYQMLERARALAAGDLVAGQSWLLTIIYAQGVTALRCGENDNCLSCACTTSCSCILPIAPSAVHVHPEGSRLAIRHFTECLVEYPNDVEARWLLNVAHMTLGEHPAKVDPRFLVSLDKFSRSEFDIGRFRDVSREAGVDRLNQAGGAIMEDFDGDGRLDIAVTSIDPAQTMGYYRNKGDGTFEDRSEAAGVLDQLGGLYCVQADYDNDGDMDIFIPRGAWVLHPVRPTLLRNDGAGRFDDVTVAAGVVAAVTSNCAQWADFDNDGWVDLFVCCEVQPNKLYRNLRNGTFEEVARAAGVAGSGRFYKGATWIDFDNDRLPDLFMSSYDGDSELFRNLGGGRFGPADPSLGVDGPNKGFSCWAWDYDNDGWLDIFATSYDRMLGDVVSGLIGRPHGRTSNRLFRNRGGRRAVGFDDVTKEAGLDLVFATMGSNYGDFDNDGYLDMYLATGDPDLSLLIPNRMFRNVGGSRFSEITASSGTGHLQKGHAVACGDYDRDGDVDLFVELGGAVYGDKYHNVLFQNPGQGNRSLTVKLVGSKTNRAAIGARIKAVTAGPAPLTVRRHVSSGSSFGANPLEQTLGLGSAAAVATLEIYWPTSDTTQVFRDIAAGQLIRITELADRYEVVPKR